MQRSMDDLGQAIGKIDHIVRFGGNDGSKTYMSGIFGNMESNGKGGLKLVRDVGGRASNSASRVSSVSTSTSSSSQRFGHWKDFALDFKGREPDATAADVLEAITQYGGLVTEDGPLTAAAVKNYLKKNKQQLLAGPPGRPGTPVDGDIDNFSDRAEVDPNLFLILRWRFSRFIPRDHLRDIFFAAIIFDEPGFLKRNACAVQDNIAKYYGLSSFDQQIFELLPDCLDLCIKLCNRPMFENLLALRGIGKLLDRFKEPWALLSQLVLGGRCTLFVDSGDDGRFRNLAEHFGSGSRDYFRGIRHFFDALDLKSFDMANPSPEITDVCRNEMQSAFQLFYEAATKTNFRALGQAAIVMCIEVLRVLKISSKVEKNLRRLEKKLCESVAEARAVVLDASAPLPVSGGTPVGQGTDADASETANAIMPDRPLLSNFAAFQKYLVLCGQKMLYARVLVETGDLLMKGYRIRDAVEFFEKAAVQIEHAYKQGRDDVDDDSLRLRFYFSWARAKIESGDADGAVVLLRKLADEKYFVLSKALQGSSAWDIPDDESSETVQFAARDSVVMLQILALSDKGEVEKAKVAVRELQTTVMTKARPDATRMERSFSEDEERIWSAWVMMRDAGVKALRKATRGSDVSTSGTTRSSAGGTSSSLVDVNPSFLKHYPSLDSIERKFEAEPGRARRFRKMWLEIVGADKLANNRFGDAARHYEDILTQTWDNVAVFNCLRCVRDNPHYQSANCQAPRKKLDELYKRFPYEMHRHQYLPLLLMETELRVCASEAFLARLEPFRNDAGSSGVVAAAFLKQARDFYDDGGDKRRALELARKSAILQEGALYAEFIQEDIRREEEGREPASTSSTTSGGAESSDSTSPEWDLDLAGVLFTRMRHDDEFEDRMFSEFSDGMLKAYFSDTHKRITLLLKQLRVEVDLRGQQVVPDDLFEWRLPTTGETIRWSDVRQDGAGASGNVHRFFGAEQFFAEVRVESSRFHDRYIDAIRQKGFVSKAQKSNGVKWDRGVVKVKISEDWRTWTDRVYVNRHGFYLCVFDREDRHTGLYREKQDLGRVKVEFVNV